MNTEDLFVIGLIGLVAFMFYQQMKAPVPVGVLAQVPGTPAQPASCGFEMLRNASGNCVSIYSTPVGLTCPAGQDALYMMGQPMCIPHPIPV